VNCVAIKTMENKRETTLENNIIPTKDFSFECKAAMKTKNSCDCVCGWTIPHSSVLPPDNSSLSFQFYSTSRLLACVFFIIARRPI
jgi:hypothetical protein